MAAPKVTVKLGPSFKKKVDALGGDILNNDFVNAVGTTVVTDMKRLIASGQSPVKGWGRFAGYKNPGKYPGGKKTSRPVNLSLTGTMLSYLSFRKSGKQIEVGILSNAPSKVKTIARVHNTGEREDIPQRKFIPVEGDDLTASIMVKVRDLFRKRILELFKA